jgi:hypothetical protein
MVTDINGCIRLAEGQYVVRSQSAPAKGHVVVREKDLTWKCDCRAALFRGRCRHISQARGHQVAVECGYDSPSAEEIEYYRQIEDGKYERALHGIPIEAP